MRVPAAPAHQVRDWWGRGGVTERRSWWWWGGGVTASKCSSLNIRILRFRTRHPTSLLTLPPLAHSLALSLSVWLSCCLPAVRLHAFNGIGSDCHNTLLICLMFIESVVCPTLPYLQLRDALPMWQQCQTLRTPCLVYGDYLYKDLYLEPFFRHPYHC